MSKLKKHISIDEIERFKDGTASPEEFLDVLSASASNEDIYELILSEDAEESDEDIRLWNNLFEKYGDQIEDFMERKSVWLPPKSDVKYQKAAIISKNKKNSNKKK